MHTLWKKKKTVIVCPSQARNKSWCQKIAIDEALHVLSGLCSFQWNQVSHYHFLCLCFCGHNFWALWYKFTATKEKSGVIESSCVQSTTFQLLLTNVHLYFCLFREQRIIFLFASILSLTAGCQGQVSRSIFPGGPSRSHLSVHWEPSAPPGPCLSSPGWTCLESPGQGHYLCQHKYTSVLNFCKRKCHMYVCYGYHFVVQSCHRTVFGECCAFMCRRRLPIFAFYQRSHQVTNF